MKQCIKCESTQNKFPKQGRQCQPCVNEGGYRSKVRKFTKIREYVEQQKSVPCLDCGGRFPTYVMDFDHLPGHTKLFTISHYQRQNRSLEQVAAEVAKCEVVCANCHRIRTFNRRAVQ